MNLWTKNEDFEQCAIEKTLFFRYQFDHVFDKEAKNRDVYEKIAFEVIESAIDGYNSTIFAYGQTSSGKTHTMMGTPNDKGIIREAVEHIFDAREDLKNERTFDMRVSFMEIYNEKISDLLQFDTKEREKSLKIQDGTDGNVNIEGLTERDIKTAEDVIKAMEEGQALRHTAGTSMNERSSRSHTIFRIQIVSCDKQSREAGFEDGRAIKVSFLNLVDLAGSERASQTGATGIRLREGKFFSSNLNGKELSSTEPPYFHEFLSGFFRFHVFRTF